MTVYEILVEMSKQHLRIKKCCGKNMGYTDTFKFDLENKSVSNGFMNIFLNGELVTDTILLSNGTEYNLKGLELISSDSDFYKTVEELYLNFKYSVPTKHDNICRTNFLANHVDDLSMEQIMNNEKRQIARCKLEAYVFLMSLTGKVKWHNERHFFWKSNNIPTLILYKRWCK